MKTYILFTFAIFGIGGTQIYARNKLLYMNKRGWKTCMVTTEPGTDILVQEMNPYQKGVFPELMRNPYLYTGRRRKVIIDRVIKYIYEFASSSDEIVIESNFMAITPWAELVAEKLKAKNFIFLIQEDYEIKSKKYLDFFHYKYLRGEFAVNTPQALSILFKDSNLYKVRYGEYLHAFCSNVVEDCSSVLSAKLPDSDFNIGSIGRINKPFVLPTISRLTTFIKHHPEKTFNLVLFGGSPFYEDIKLINKETENIPNLHTIITGPIFPIPLCDLKKMDVCVSSAGAANTSTDAGILTIAIDAVDFSPIGIVGCTTENIIHRESSNTVSMDELLDQILIEKKFEGMLKEKIEDYSTYFNEHESMRINSVQEHSYYKVSLMAPKMRARLAYWLFGALASTICRLFKAN